MTIFCSVYQVGIEDVIRRDSAHSRQSERVVKCRQTHISLFDGLFVASFPPRGFKGEFRLLYLFGGLSGIFFCLVNNAAQPISISLPRSFFGFDLLLGENKDEERGPFSHTGEQKLLLVCLPTYTV